MFNNLIAMSLLAIAGLFLLFHMFASYLFNYQSSEANLLAAALLGGVMVLIAFVRIGVLLALLHVPC